MPVIKQIENQISQVKALKTITGALSEISSFKISSIKQSFEQNSLYYEEISQVYHLIQRVASEKEMSLSININQQTKSEKTLYIAITSNHGFYGSLNSDTIDKMAEDTSAKQADRMIIGTMGISYARGIQKLSPFDSFVFEQDEPKSSEIQQLLEQISKYSKVFLYYPKFINMFNQSVDKIDITYAPEPGNAPDQDIKYLFEPELPKILAFFMDQVRYILFVRVLLETNLSRTATRLISMDAAERRAGKLVKKLSAQTLRLRQSAINAELISSAGHMKKLRKRSL